jgi:hypothetical protein
MLDIPHFCASGWLPAGAGSVFQGPGGWSRPSWPETRGGAPRARAPHIPGTRSPHWVERGAKWLAEKIWEHRGGGFAAGPSSSAVLCALPPQPMTGSLHSRKVGTMRTVGTAADNPLKNSENDRSCAVPTNVSLLKLVRTMGTNEGSAPVLAAPIQPFFLPGKPEARPAAAHLLQARP